MAFLIFKKERYDNGVYYSDTHQHYILAGGKNGLLCKLWNKRNKPIECGWSVTADDLLKEYGEGFNGEEYALVIDFHPSAQNRIGLMEIEVIHIYTYGESNGAWSPMMLELRDVYYEEFDEPLTNRKDKILARIELPSNRQKVVEFLYLQDNWGWGRNGSTNAAFIRNDARRYFQRAFTSEANGS